MASYITSITLTNVQQLQNYSLFSSQLSLPYSHLFYIVKSFRILFSLIIFLWPTCGEVEMTICIAIIDCYS